MKEDLFFLKVYYIKKNVFMNKLNDLLLFCSKNKINFTYQNEDDENYIIYNVEPTEQLIVNIVDPEDENLDKLLGDKLIELQNRFQ